MNHSRIARVIENMNACGLDQILVTGTPSVYYLTGNWVNPGERMLALYINVSGEATLMAESSKISARTPFDAFKAGDAAAARVIEKYTTYLANGISSLINIFQPDVFIIGGGISGEKQFLIDLLQPKVDEEDFARTAKNRTRLCTAICGNDAGIIGAAFAV